MILEFDGKRFSGTSGYAYPASGEIVATSSSIKPSVLLLTLTCMGTTNLKTRILWLNFSCSLIVSGKYSITFEDTDETR